eukprot:jgi/Mesvir1/1737/Mv21189-RA.1
MSAYTAVFPVRKPAQPNTHRGVPFRCSARHGEPHLRSPGPRPRASPARPPHSLPWPGAPGHPRVGRRRSPLSAHPCYARAAPGDAPTGDGTSARPLRVLISTGDTSGDMHAASLVRELLAAATARGIQLEVAALGGARVQAAGATLLADVTGLSSIGVLEALPLVLPSLRIQARVRSVLVDAPPDVAVLIDYPGVNIPFGRYLKEQLRVAHVIYYIPPNEWLVTGARTPTICSMADAILAVYPDEAAYFAQQGGKVHYVGHPLVDSVAAAAIPRHSARQLLRLSQEDVVVALLPASRRQEVKLLWPVMLAAAQRLQRLFAQQEQRRCVGGGGGGSGGKGLQAGWAPASPPRRLVFLAPQPDGDLRARMMRVCEGVDGVHCRVWGTQGEGADGPGGPAVGGGAGEESVTRVGLWAGNSLVVLAAADAALTKSGSVNVELALLGVPQVVAYRLDRATAWVARHLLRLRVPHICLVNLIMDERIVPEHLQEEAEPQALAKALLPLLPPQREGADGGSEGGGREMVDAASERTRILEGYRRFLAFLGGEGASRRAASHVLSCLNICEAESLPLVLPEGERPQ